MDPPHSENAFTRQPACRWFNRNSAGRFSERQEEDLDLGLLKKADHEKVCSTV